MSKERVCANCKWFDPYYAKGDPPPHGGTCGRYPPVWVGNSCDVETLVSTDVWAHPYVGAYGNCGEWKKRKKWKKRKRRKGSK